MRFQSGNYSNYKCYDRGDQEGIIILAIPECDYERNQHRHSEKSQYRAYETDDGIIIHVWSVSLVCTDDPYRKLAIPWAIQFHEKDALPGAES